MEDLDRLAKGLTEAQRDTMLGHMVEIPPHEYDELIDLGLKRQAEKQRVVYDRWVYPLTDLGLALRNHLKGTE